MARRKTQRYWVETQAQDDTWSPCRPDSLAGYSTTVRRWLYKDADHAVSFMEKVITFAMAQGVRIKGIRVMQIDPEDRENLYHLGQLPEREAEHG